MMKKKIFALVLALVMVLALVPAMAQAGSEQEDVTISKTATAVEGMVNAWDIELTVNAAAKVNPHARQRRHSRAGQLQLHV